MLKLIKIYKWKLLIAWMYWLFIFQHINYKKHLKYILFYFYKLTSKGKLEIENKKKEAIKTIKDTFFSKKWIYNFEKLPDKGIEEEDVKSIISGRKSTSLNNKISGCLYIKDKHCERLLKDVNNQYLFSNPLHPDIFPELNKMESEIIKMVGSLYDLTEMGGGNLTTGGTESTILALKAYKKYKKKSLHLFRPEVLCTKTVHAAVNKACELLDLKIVYVNLNDDYVMDITDLKNKISFRSCVIVASAPCFAYGLMDPIKEISFIAERYKVPLHVDACLGGFICQFNKKLRLTFNDNIQSISIDPHKFGYAPKGSSILLWKDEKMKHNQYFVVQDWTGGIYASTSLPGSRVGSQIATTWTTLLYHGYESYKNYSKKIIEKTEYLKNEISKIKTFHVIGNPNVNVVAFYSDTYSVGQLSEHLTSFLWNVNILQNPICLHICVTPKNIKACQDLPSTLRLLLKHKVKNSNKSITAIYGMAAQIPDKSIITEIVENYLDLTTNC